jgi:serine/threonine protein kinase
LDENNNIKISDFGKSALIRDQNKENFGKDEDLFSSGGTQTGHGAFVCPEILKDQSYDFQADIYPLGITILNLMCFIKQIY